MEQARTSTKLVGRIFDAKYEKLYINKFMKNQFHHSIDTQLNKLPKLLPRFREMLNITLGT